LINNFSHFAQHNKLFILLTAANQRRSSVGSISPRSCDVSSQGSDTHSSPFHISHIPPAEHPAENQRVNGADPAKSSDIKQGVGSQSSLVCRITPISSQITEGCSVTIDNQPGIVKWIGYEIAKPGRYFAGVKMVSGNILNMKAWKPMACCFKDLMISLFISRAMVIVL